MRSKRYEDAGISKSRYLELMNIAMQYDEMLEREAKLRRGEFDRTARGNGGWSKPDPTGNAAIFIASMSKADKIRAIEDSARAAGPGIYLELMRNVTQGTKYEDMPVPCGRAQFYAARRRFFIELDGRIA